MVITLTIFFEDPFWVGIFERSDGVTLEISRVVFGAEPRDCAVREFILREYASLHYGPPVTLDEAEHKKVNPKRLKKIIHKETLEGGVGTKAQQALKIAFESSQKEAAKLSKDKRKELAQEKFEQRREKKKEKKRGR